MIDKNNYHIIKYKKEIDQIDLKQKSEIFNQSGYNIFSFSNNELYLCRHKEKTIKKDTIRIYEIFHDCWNLFTEEKIIFYSILFYSS